MASSRRAPQMPLAAPTMPELDVGEIEDDDGADDPQDENHLMSILQKLKSAKHTLDSSRQKKKTKQLMEQTADRFNIDTTEIVNKHNKRWATKFSNINQKAKKLKTAAEEDLKEWNESNVDFGKRLSIHKVGIQNILQSITAMEAEFQANKEARTAATAGELEQIRAQVAEKLKQVQTLLIKTHSRSMKDDKFTQIIKSFISSF